MQGSLLGFERSALAHGSACGVYDASTQRRVQVPVGSTLAALLVARVCLVGGIAHVSAGGEGQRKRAQNMHDIL